MRAERPIISNPEKQSRTQKIVSIVITALAWALWGYLWLPALAVISSVFGFRVDYLFVVRKPDESSLILIFLIMLVCNTIVSSWSSYNYIRFAKSSRRRRPKFVTHQEVCKTFGSNDPDTQSQLLRERRLALHFDDAGALVTVEVLGGDSVTKPDK
jgi:poly-beta-1,6-N-acetyl-D-glucosamine biosynthesis protein PgaD